MAFSFFFFADEIHLASFAAFGYSGTGQHIGGHLDGMSHFAINDVNSGLYYGNVLQGKLRLRFYDISMRS